jgi:histidine triad (HIT) family protein
VEYWERQHSSHVAIMDDGPSLSGMSRGHQRRRYDQRRQAWADENGLRLVILDYRGFETGPSGRLVREVERDRRAVANALRASGALDEPSRTKPDQPDITGAAGAGCFLCRLAQGDPALHAHSIVWQDRDLIALLHPWPAVYGHVVVAPKAHIEHVTGNQTLHEYLRQQRVVYALAEAVRLALRPERVYVLSLGSRHDTRHVQWDVVPCPPGVLPEEQQLALLDVVRRGVLHLTTEESHDLVARLQANLPGWMQR